MNTATPFTLASEGLRDLEGLLDAKLQVLELSGHAPDSFLRKACEELQQLLVTGIELIERTTGLPDTRLPIRPLAHTGLVSSDDSRVLLEIELSLDSFLLSGFSAK